MPRQPRSDAPGVVHHVWCRGIDGRPIFLDDHDRRDLIGRFERVLPESGTSCFGFAFMSNHLHAVLKTGAVPLATVMKRIHTGFALRFNRRRGRHGYLFQSRYGSRIVRDDADLVAVIAYVLRNPLKAALVRNADELERYPWSSYAALVGRREPFAFESVLATLAIFDPAPEVARDRVRALILRLPDEAQRPTSLDELIRQVCREHAVAEQDLRTGRRARTISRARAHVCKRAAAELGLGPTAIARALGIVHSAVVQAIRK